MSRFNLARSAPMMDAQNIATVRAAVDITAFRPRQDGQPHKREEITLARLQKIHSRKYNLKRPPPMDFDGDEDMRALGALPGEWWFVVQYYWARGCAATALGARLTEAEVIEYEAYLAAQATPAPVEPDSGHMYWDDDVH